MSQVYQDPEFLRLDEEEEEGEETPEEYTTPGTTPSGLTSSVRNLLFKSRTLIISGEVNQKLAANVMGQLLAMSSLSDDMITIFINSQGGHVESGDTIHDVIRYVSAPVQMVGTGWVASAGALIFVAVPKERRYSLPRVPPMSRSRRAKFSRCASGSTRFLPTRPASRSSAFRMIRAATSGSARRKRSITGWWAKSSRILRN